MHGRIDRRKGLSRHLDETEKIKKESEIQSQLMQLKSFSLELQSQQMRIGELITEKSELAKEKEWNLVEIAKLKKIVYGKR